MNELHSRKNIESLARLLVNTWRSIESADRIWARAVMLAGESPSRVQFIRAVWNRLGETACVS